MHTMATPNNPRTIAYQSNPTQGFMCLQLRVIIPGAGASLRTARRRLVDRLVLQILLDLPVELLVQHCSGLAPLAYASSDDAF